MSEKSGQQKKRHVFIIEDSEDSRILYQRALKSEDIEISAAENGLQALQMLDGAQCPDL